MEYKVIGKTVPVVETTLQAGESMYTQSGGMAYQTDGITMHTNTNGGIMKGLGRVFAGESLFVTHYTAQRDGAQIGFASTVPGNIMSFNLEQFPNGLIFQKGAFLAAQSSVQTSISFTKKLSTGFFGGEGFILQQAVGNGMLFLEVDGDPIVKDLAPGEVLKVNTGNVVAFSPSVSYEIEMVKGIGNIFLGREGLFLTRLVGPGKVALQSQNFDDFAGQILQYMPKK